MQNTHSSLVKARRRQSGFTLVEIMVVIVILGMLMAIVGTSVLGSSDEAKISTAKMDVHNIYKAVQLYMSRARSSGIPTWEDLITPDPETGRRILEYEDPKQDPWGNVYQITPDPDFERNPMVTSWGPDGEEGTEDDINNKNITARKER